jgi:hypothetical protein
MPEGPSLDFSEISRNATEYLQNSDQGSEVTQSTNSEVPSQGQPAKEPTFEFEFTPGKKEQATLSQIKQWREGNLRQEDYTRKTQEVAEMRKSAENVFKAYQQMQQEREVVAAFLQNPEQVAQFMVEQYGPQGLQLLLTSLAGVEQAPNPSDVATVSQAEKIAQKQAAQVARQLEQTKQEMRSEIEQERERARYEAEVQEYTKMINPVIQDIFNNNPILSAVDGMEDLIRYKVYKLNPQSPQDAINAFQRVAKEQVEKLNSRYTELNKKQIVQKSKLANGTEPPGGSGVQPQAKTFRKGNSVDWKALASSAADYLNQSQGS